MVGTRELEIAYTELSNALDSLSRSVAQSDLPVYLHGYDDPDLCREAVTGLLSPSSLHFEEQQDDARRITKHHCLIAASPLILAHVHTANLKKEAFKAIAVSQKKACKPAEFRRVLQSLDLVSLNLKEAYSLFQILDVRPEKAVWFERSQPLTKVISIGDALDRLNQMPASEAVDHDRKRLEDLRLVKESRRLVFKHVPSTALRFQYQVRQGNGETVWRPAITGSRPIFYAHNEELESLPRLTIKEEKSDRPGAPLKLKAPYLLTLPVYISPE